MKLEVNFKHLCVNLLIVDEMLVPSGFESMCKMQLAHTDSIFLLR